MSAQSETHTGYSKGCFPRTWNTEVFCRNYDAINWHHDDKDETKDKTKIETNNQTTNKTQNEN